MHNRTLISSAAKVAPLLVLLMATPAHAYVGPGAGVSLFGAAIGLLVAIFSAIGVILLWPIRMLAKKLSRLRTGSMPVDHPKSRAC